MNNDAPRLMIALLAAATIAHDDPNLDDWRAAEPDDRLLLIRDYRDEFASSPFEPLAAARLDADLIELIYNILTDRI